MKRLRFMTVAAVAAGVVLVTATGAHAGTDSPFVFTKSEVNGIPAGQGAFFHDGDRFWIEDTARDGRSAVLDIKVYKRDGRLHRQWQLWNSRGFDYDLIRPDNVPEGYTVSVRACVGHASDKSNFWGCGSWGKGRA
ncbi:MULTISPECIES: hypothetical protein [Streptomyces]|uniref:Secreted protein n=3 Tax=Streptomyces TaxID=1883 RepID=A0ABS9J8Z4_9ACTN|nr:MULTISPECIES: hypothetical protein [Streptomyces]MCG0061999.1 hypothetical protein [Streptomyces tricolor]OYP10540.1 hypothetical protein CFC35_40810 [Streptomyces sp. FBKL.4005]BCM72823.1 hypothetical protein EASAB2608_08157 [Streptomyces sp. EAS-AB2608]CUW33105.1 hypothetical protein TUE45_pSRTUE45c_0473 [Streptomyces reticuli]